jgi:hypothetical protein
MPNATLRSAAFADGNAEKGGRARTTIAARVMSHSSAGRKATAHLQRQSQVGGLFAQRGRHSAL